MCWAGPERHAGPVITATSLSKHHGAVTPVDGVSFSCEPGSSDPTALVSPCRDCDICTPGSLVRRSAAQHRPAGAAFLHSALRNRRKVCWQEQLAAYASWERCAGAWRRLRSRENDLPPELLPPPWPASSPGSQIYDGCVTGHGLPAPAGQLTTFPRETSRRATGGPRRPPRFGPLQEGWFRLGLCTGDDFLEASHEPPFP